MAIQTDSGLYSTCSNTQVSAADAEADAQLTLDGETQGVPRIMAALEAHTWPGLRLKDRHASAPAEPNGKPLPPLPSRGMFQDNVTLCRWCFDYHRGDGGRAICKP